MKTMLLGIVLVAVAGCASAPVPADRLARTRETLALAQAVPYSQSDPRAAQHLELAKNQLNQARRMMQNGDNDQAAWVLMRAESDAEAALNLGHARAAQVDAQQTVQRIRQEMQTLQQQEGRGS